MSEKVSFFLEKVSLLSVESLPRSFIFFTFDDSFFFLSYIKLFFKKKCAISFQDVSIDVIQRMVDSEYFSESIFDCTSQGRYYIVELKTKSSLSMIKKVFDKKIPHSSIIFIVSSKELLPYLRDFDFYDLTLPVDKWESLLVFFSSLLERDYTYFFSALEKKAVARQESFYIEDVCRYIRYVPLVKKEKIAFFLENTMSNLQQEKKSIYKLADLFFKKKKDFFSLWQKIVSLFAPEFWISFWINQLWSAAVVSYAKKQGMNTSPLVYRGSYWFLRYGIHSVSFAKLSESFLFLNAIYSIHKIKGTNIVTDLEAFFYFWFE
jgi:hypothetical protein